MLSEPDEDHYNPSVRQIQIERNGNCGFKLTRSKWDPYPWVTSVDDGSVAEIAGIKLGDCVLEVDGKDVVGQRISEIAEIFKSKSGKISLLLWNAGVDSQCSPEALCCGPMPNNLQKLSACMSRIVAYLECPVCLDTIQAPTYQCDNGHLICIRCRSKSEKCPVCRIRFNRSRSLLADQVYNALSDSFNLREESNITKREKIHQIFRLKNKNINVPDIKITHTSHTNKLITKLIGKASSVDSLNHQQNSQNLSASNNSLNVNLKAKSLSTNEIFRDESHCRSPSPSRFNRNESNTESTNYSSNRPSSYYGSYDSLTPCKTVGKEVPATSNSLTCLKVDYSSKDTFYHCPFQLDCGFLTNGEDLITHFQLNHKGPLVQYFSNSINICLKDITQRNNSCYVINKNEDTFLLKTIVTNNGDNSNMSPSSILIWIWYLGTKQNSKEYEVQFELKNEESNAVLLSVRSSVFSLTVSEKEIKERKKGVYLIEKTLNALGYSKNKIVLSIIIEKN